MSKHPTSQTTKIMNGGGDASRARHSRDVELKPKRETHKNTRKRVREKTVDGEIITLVPPPEDPVKRRLLKKTDLRNDEEVVINVDEQLVNVVNMLTKYENMPEAN